MLGKWIVFEGLDGSGTTTQAKLLAQRLHNLAGFTQKVLLTAEPTDGPFGQTCKSALHKQIRLHPRTLALAFCADRSNHLHKPGGVLESIQDGHWVIQDRYLYSTLAYQDSEDNEWLWQINAAFPRPDLVVYLETEPGLCLERIGRRGETRDLFEDESALERVAESYRKVFEKESERTTIVTLDGSIPIEVLHECVWEQLKSWIPS